MSNHSFTLTINKKGRLGQNFKTSLDFEYNDKNFHEIENLIRDTVVKLANDYINKEFYD